MLKLQPIPSQFQNLTWCPNCGVQIERESLGRNNCWKVENSWCIVKVGWAKVELAILRWQKFFGRRCLVAKSNALVDVLCMKAFLNDNLKWCWLDKDLIQTDDFRLCLRCFIQKLSLVHYTQYFTTHFSEIFCFVLILQSHGCRVQFYGKTLVIGRDLCVG